MNYITRTLSTVIIPEGDPIFSERATEIKIVDEAAGEFIELSQNELTIVIDVIEWPHIKAAIDKAIKDIEKYGKKP